MDPRSAARAYDFLVDTLRELRRSNPPNLRQLERDALDNLADLHDLLDPADQARVNLEGWRGWPDLYDAQCTTPPAFCPDCGGENDPGCPCSDCTN